MSSFSCTAYWASFWKALGFFDRWKLLSMPRMFLFRVDHLEGVYGPSHRISVFISFGIYHATEMCPHPRDQVQRFSILCDHTAAATASAEKPSEIVFLHTTRPSFSFRSVQEFTTHSVQHGKSVIATQLGQ